MFLSTLKVTYMYYYKSVHGHTLNGHTLCGHTLYGHTLYGHTLYGHTLYGHTLNGHTLNGTSLSVVIVQFYWPQIHTDYTVSAHNMLIFNWMSL
mgnify:CR=1 FL=1